MTDPRDTSKDEQMAFLQHQLLGTLIAMRELDPQNYLVRLFSDALNGKLKPVPITQQRALPLI